MALFKNTTHPARSKDYTRVFVLTDADRDARMSQPLSIFRFALELFVTLSSSQLDEPYVYGQTINPANIFRGNTDVILCQDY
ncbi:hypothetical protein ACFL00_03895 [Pseudomonadota bacterium]